MHRLKDYEYELPQELIAQEPARPRDHARLLVYSRADKSITDDNFYNLEKYLPSDATLVVNNSKVEQCRWLFHDGKTELFVLEKLDTHTVRALIRPGKKFRIGKVLQLTDWLAAETTAIDDDGIRTVRLSVPHDDPRLLTYEHIPLPPYIAQNDELADEYQNVYADPLGSKAAPTAGLHFTPELLESIGKTHDIAELTLHVGLGTFAEVTEKNLRTGHLHAESYSLDTENIKKLTSARHITAVGTTTVRTLESIANNLKANPHELHGQTDIFIQPGYKFQLVDSMITNFHLPGTSLLMLVAAFIADGDEMDLAVQELHRIYAHAINKRYRFYSFGDAMLIL